MHIKKGEKVIVIAGNDKGQTGEVLVINHKKGRVIVEGVNLRWKHKKGTQENPKGERVQEASSLHASNVMHYDAKAKKRSRKPTKAEA